MPKLDRVKAELTIENDFIVYSTVWFLFVLGCLASNTEEWTVFGIVGAVVCLVVTALFGLSRYTLQSY